MNLEIEVKSNAAIATNVQSVAAECITQLQKYRGCVATPETLKSDKDACANINKLKKFISDERIAFDKRVAEQPDVKAVHDALKAVELECDAIRGPYWESVKAIVEADKPAEETFNVTIALTTVTAKQLESIKKKLTKDGIAYQVQSMWSNK